MEYFPPNLDGVSTRPSIVYTDGYLNDPIQTNADSRFQPTTLLQHISASASGGVSQYERDQANFVLVELSSAQPRHVSVEMKSPMYKPAVLDRVVNRTFEQFKVTLE